MSDLFHIPYVRAMWLSLASSLHRDGKLVIYGAGEHTRWLLGVTADLPVVPIRCIVDDAPSAKKLAGVAVQEASQVSLDPADVVLISSDQWEDQLYQKAVDRWGRATRIVRLYADVSPGPYDKRDDRTEALKLLANERRGQDFQVRQVVIVSDQPRAREAKIGYALQRAGWHPVLLHGHPAPFEVARYFTDSFRYSHAWEALRLAAEREPEVYHVMVNGNYRTAALFVRHKPGPTIVDSYDLIAGMYTEAYLAKHSAYAAQIQQERFCLERADGVCSRSREASLVAAMLGYRYRRLFYFPDGCWNLPTPQQETQEGLHLAFVGGVEGFNVAKMEFVVHGCHGGFIQELAEQGLYFHLYPAFSGSHEAFARTFADYQTLAGQSPYFSLHAPVPPDQLGHELARYAFAVFVYPSAGDLAKAQAPLTPLKRRGCTSNKFYDYWDAGLPILHNAAPNSLLFELVDRFGAGVDVSDWPINQWRDRLEKLDRLRLQAAATTAREAYDVCRQSAGLTEFYCQVQEVAQCDEPKSDVAGVRCDVGQSSDEGNRHVDNPGQHRATLV